MHYCTSSWKRDIYCIQEVVEKYGFSIFFKIIFGSRYILKFFYFFILCFAQFMLFRHPRLETYKSSVVLQKFSPEDNNPIDSVLNVGRHFKMLVEFLDFDISRYDMTHLICFQFLTIFCGRKISTDFGGKEPNGSTCSLKPATKKIKAPAIWNPNYIRSNSCLTSLLPRFHSHRTQLADILVAVSRWHSRLPSKLTTYFSCSLCLSPLLPSLIKVQLSKNVDRPLPPARKSKNIAWSLLCLLPVWLVFSPAQSTEPVCPSPP